MKQESNKFFEKRKFIILCAVFVCACILVFKKFFVIIRRTFSYENFVFSVATVTERRSQNEPLLEGKDV